eukprot:365598-Chlamydomonas_euryale.AAC.3
MDPPLARGPAHRPIAPRSYRRRRARRDASQHAPAVAWLMRSWLPLQRAAAGVSRRCARPAKSALAVAVVVVAVAVRMNMGAGGRCGDEGAGCRRRAARCDARRRATMRSDHARVLAWPWAGGPGGGGSRTEGGRVG